MGSNPSPSALKTSSSFEDAVGSDTIEVLVPPTATKTSSGFEDTVGSDTIEVLVPPTVTIKYLENRGGARVADWARLLSECWG